MIARLNLVRTDSQGFVKKCFPDSPLFLKHSPNFHQIFGTVKGNGESQNNCFILKL